jgi:hypothetical protein
MEHLGLNLLNCQNTVLNCGFAKYHYNFVSHLLEHTALSKKEVIRCVLGFWQRHN